jgi:hypothetical protein
LPKGDGSPPGPPNHCVRTEMLSEDEPVLRKVRDEFARFELAMEELHFLRRIAQDLKSFKEMIKLKMYD